MLKAHGNQQRFNVIMLDQKSDDGFLYLNSGQRYSDPFINKRQMNKRRKLMTTVTNQTSDTTETKKSTFLTDETFELLKNAQKRLQDETGFSPTLKVLINDTVNDESVNKTIERFQQKLASLQD